MTLRVQAVLSAEAVGTATEQVELQEPKRRSVWEDPAHATCEHELMTGVAARLEASRFVKLSSRTSGKLSRGGGEQPKMELRSTSRAAAPARMARSSSATPMFGAMRGLTSVLPARSLRSHTTESKKRDPLCHQRMVTRDERQCTVAARQVTGRATALIS